MNVFVSYTWADREVAQAVIDRLRDAGHDVSDPLELPLGSESVSELSTKIRSSDVVVAIGSVSRPNLLFELGLAVGALRPVVVASANAAALPLDVQAAPHVSLSEDPESDAAAIVRRVGEVQVSAPTRHISEGRAETVLRSMVSDALVESLISPVRFEELVAEYLRGIGMDVVRAAPTRDTGFDLAVTAGDGRLVLIELKKYRRENRVSVATVQRLLGAVVANKARAGLLISTSGFTRAATEFASRSSVVVLRTIEELLGASTEDELLHVGRLRADGT